MNTIDFETGLVSNFSLPNVRMAILTLKPADDRSRDPTSVSVAGAGFIDGAW